MIMPTANGVIAQQTADLHDAEKNIFSMNRAATTTVAPATTNAALATANAASTTASAAATTIRATTSNRARTTSRGATSATFTAG